MSRIKVDRITNRAGTGDPLFPNGVSVVGLTSLSNVIAGVATFSNVTIGGTITYDDVTNIDSVGIVTARSGVKVTDGGIDVTAGGIDVTAGGVNVTAGAITVSDDGINASSNLILKTGGTEQFRIKSNGRVGIGTDDPQAELVVGNHNSGDTYLQVCNSTTGFDANSGFIIGLKADEGATLYQLENNYMRFGTNQQERLRIGADGQFGLGGANYGTSGQVITSQGASAAPQWATPGGGSWEVLSTTDFATSPANYSENTGWTTDYQSVKLQYSFLRQTSANCDCSVRFYMHTAYGNNGTLKTATEYKWGYSNKSWNVGALGNGGSNDANRWRLANSGGGQWWSGEITFRIGTGVPGYNYPKAAWGWTERESQFGMDSCYYDTDTSNVIVGARIYNDGGANWSEGRATWYGVKYS